MTQPRRDRFEMFNKQKPAYVYQPYPKMLHNDDGTTTIVQNEEEHRKVSGRRFDPETLVGARSGEAGPEPIQMSPQPTVFIPDNARSRQGAKMRNLDGKDSVDATPGPAPEALVQEAG